MPFPVGGRLVIRMASSTLPQRCILVLASTVPLVSCIGDGMAPPGADSVLIGRVGEPVAFAREPVRSHGAWGTVGDAGRVGDISPGIGDPRGATALPAQAELRAGSDRQASPRGQAMAQPMPQSMPQPVSYSIPAEGVNIDAELGVGDGNPLGVGEVAPQTRTAPVAAQIMVPQGPMAIAEGQTSQPVVDGIGTDEPHSLDGSTGAGG